MLCQIKFRTYKAQLEKIEEVLNLHIFKNFKLASILNMDSKELNILHCNPCNDSESENYETDSTNLVGSNVNNVGSVIEERAQNPKNLFSIQRKSNADYDGSEYPPTFKNFNFQKEQEESKKVEWEEESLDKSSEEKSHSRFDVSNIPLRGSINMKSQANGFGQETTAAEIVFETKKWHEV